MNPSAWLAAPMTAVLCLASASAGVPQLDSFSPSALTRGATHTWTVRGNELAGRLALYHPLDFDAVAQDSDDPKQRTFKLEIPDTAPLGIYPVRVASEHGVSNVQLVLIDDLPTVGRGRDHHVASSAHPIAWPAAVDGVCQREKANYYRITGKANQPLSLDVVAHRLGSKLDAFLRVFDAKSGREIAYNDDFPGSGRDSRLTVTLPRNGDYLIEIRDVEYNGGGEYTYRLRVGDFPLVAAGLPMAVPAEGAQPVLGLTPAGPIAAQVQLVPGVLPRASGWLAVPGREGRGSSFAPLAITTQDELVHGDEPSSRDEPRSLPVPGAVHGRLTNPRQSDWYRFEVDEAGPWRLRPTTGRLGSPAWVALTLYDDEGKQLARSDQADDNQGLLKQDLKPGAYRLRVQDVAGRGGPTLAYRVQLAPDEPTFSLRIEDPDKKDTALARVQTPPGGRIGVKVVANRQGFDGPIALVVRPQQADPAAEPWATATIEAEKTTVVLQVPVPEQVEPGSVLALQIDGWPDSVDNGSARTATTTAAYNSTLQSLPHPVPGFGREIIVGVIRP